MPQPPMENVKTNNLIGEKSVFEGRFLVNGAIQINGKFEGEIVKVDQVNVGRTGRVKIEYRCDFRCDRGNCDRQYQVDDSSDASADCQSPRGYPDSRTDYTERSGFGSEGADKS